MESIEIPEGVIYIGMNSNSRVFKDCTALKTVKFPSTLQAIGLEAFANCTSLDLNIPDNISTIWENAFKGVPHITYNGTATGSPWGALSIN